MCLHVFLHVGLLSKRSATDDALKWFLSCVASNVLLKIKVFRKDFVTEITLQLWTFAFQLLCGSVGALFATPWSFGNDDLFKVTQLRQVGGDAAGLGFGALLPGTVDRRGVV